jgi:hypothetical protein
MIKKICQYSLERYKLFFWEPYEVHTFTVLTNTELYCCGKMVHVVTTGFQTANTVKK